MRRIDVHAAIRAVFVASLLAFWSGCGDSDQSVEAERASFESRQAKIDSVQLGPAEVIGLVSGDAEYLFGSITAVATDPAGRIYVGDASPPSVRVFDRDGSFLTWIAREGGGPGEIEQRPASVIFGADGRLYVRDARRITAFGSRAGGEIVDSVVAVWNTPGLGNTTSSRSALTRDGRYFYPGGRYPRDELPRYYYAVYRDGELDGDTFDVPPYPGLRGLRPAILPLGGDGLMLRGLNRVPFSPVPVWDVTPAGTLVSSDGASAFLLETDAAGDTVRTIRVSDHSSRPVPASEQADSLAALEERIGEAEERIARFQGRLGEVVGLGQGVEERRLPRSLPSAIGLSVTQSGSIWVERWPPEGEQDSRYYDVLGPSGMLERVVILRAPLVRDPSPWFGDHSIAGIIKDPETGVERVARFDLTRRLHLSAGFARRR